jgi:hypothetical protein
MSDHVIIHGDMRDVLASMEPNSVDAIVCDPPYELTDGRKASPARVFAEVMLENRAPRKSKVASDADLELLAREIAGLCGIRIVPCPTAAVPVGAVALDDDAPRWDDNVKHARVAPVLSTDYDRRGDGEAEAPVHIGNLSLNLLFIVILPEGWKHAGLALGTVASEAGQVTCLAWLTHRRHARLNLRPLFLAFGKQGLACIPLIATVLLLPSRLPQWGNALTLFTTIGVAALLYLLSARLLRCRELHEFRHH